MFPLRHPALQRQRITTQQTTVPLRRWRAPAEEEHSWWTITFSDLVLLLLCFVILWHISEKRELLARAQKTIPLSQEIQAPPQEPELSSVAPAPETTAWSPQESPEPILEAAVSSSSLEEPSPQTAPTNADWQELQREVTQYAHEQGLDRAIGVVSTEQGLVISLNDTITFPSGQATLNVAVTPFLSRVAALASERTELNIEIAGHTDDRPIATSEFPSNWELSAARASRVARTLLEQQQIDPTRVSTRGFAHYRPLYANDTDEHRATNRRVEIRFFHRVEPLDESSSVW